jgi:Zn-dependent protease with chaperone function
VHVLLGLSSLLLVVLAGAVALAALRRLRSWGARRDTQLLVLTAPLVSLALGISAVHHFSGQVCWLEAPPWDYTIGLLLPLAMGVVALGGLAVGVVRLALMARVFGQTSRPAGTELQAITDHLAAGVGAPATHVRLCDYGGPLALATGLRRSTLLLSTWVVDHLDRRELEAVLAHELGHVARRDYLITWVAAVLRDAFFYLPTSRAAFGQLRRDNELASDDLAVAVTRRPLALASALVKVWQHALGLTTGVTTAQAAAPALLGTATGTSGSGAIEHRIERLMAAAPGEMPAGRRSRAAALGAATVALAGLLALEAANATVFLAPMACDPRSALFAVVHRLI